MFSQPWSPLPLPPVGQGPVRSRADPVGSLVRPLVVAVAPGAQLDARNPLQVELRDNFPVRRQRTRRAGSTARTGIIARGNSRAYREFLSSLLKKRKFTGFLRKTDPVFTKITDGKRRQLQPSVKRSIPNRF